MDKRFSLHHRRAEVETPFKHEYNAQAVEPPAKRPRQEPHTLLGEEDSSTTGTLLGGGAPPPPPPPDKS